MIEQLYIKNVTIIEELEMNFAPGLNILSGETGAGKSIIMESVAFILGGRLSSDFIRRGREMASVSALVLVNPENLDFLSNFDIPMEEDKKLLITRTITSSGKNNLRINGKSFPMAILKEIGSLLVDIHGQFEHHNLINQAKHIHLLDKFCDLDEPKADLAKNLDEYKKLNDEIKKIETEQENIDNLREILEELDKLDLKPGEEEEIANRITYLNNHKEIGEGIAEAAELLGEDNSALGQISKALRVLRKIEHLDDNVSTTIENLENINTQLAELIGKLSPDDSFDANELAELEARINTIYSVKRKYKKETEELLAYHKETAEELSLIEGGQLSLDKLKSRLKSTGEQVINICNRITSLRQIAKELLETEIVKNLVELNMENVKFSVSLEKKQTFSPNGNDIVEFLISPNLGEPLKPLAKIASGGEMSRVMLALKVVLSHANTIQTFVFDEIDAGVSGRTAQKVALKLRDLAETKQILCITHLPQIAAMANEHFLIEKRTKEDSTYTTITPLKGDAAIGELARLIGGTQITENTLTAAKEMKQMAIQTSI